MLHSRINRVAELIKAELAEIIDQQLRNPKIPPFVTVLSVKVARDLRVADVYVTFLADSTSEEIDATVRELNKAAGFIRSTLARQIRLKYLPALKFHYNPSTHYAVDLSHRLQELAPAEEEPERSDD